MSMLLENNILDRFMQVNVITGLVLLVIGIILAFVSGPITKAVRKVEKVSSNDKLFLVLKAFALILILVALIVMIIE